MNQRLQKVIFISLIFCLMLGLTPLVSASSGTFRATESVRVRSEPSTDGSVITVVHSGDSIEVLDHNPAGWSMVQIGNSTGFIRSDFLRFPIGDTAAVFQTTEGVNLRASASTSAEVLVTVPAGANVDVFEHDPAGWSRVSVGGTSGFIRSDFLTRGGSGNSAAASTTASTASTSNSSNSITTLYTTGTVRLRAGPSTDNDIVRNLSVNTGVEVIENQANGWSKVRHRNSSGYIRSDLLATSPSTITLKTTDSVNMRSGPSTNNNVTKTLAAGTDVGVLEQLANGWSRVLFNGTEGFIRSDFLGGSTSSKVIATLKTLTGVNLRSGPSTSHNRLRLLTVNTDVDVLENRSDGWSRVRHNGTEGFIRSDFLGGGIKVELIDWATAKKLIPKNTDLRVYDVRSGTSYNIKAFSLGNHADVDTSTQTDTNLKRATRDGAWAWAPRPVWVTVGERTFAASINGMPHAGSAVSGNGLSGHFCLHFRGSTSHGSTSASYVRNMQNAITEAWNARPNQ